MVLAIDCLIKITNIFKSSWSSHSKKKRKGVFLLILVEARYIQTVKQSTNAPITQPHEHVLPHSSVSQSAGAGEGRAP